MGAEVGCKRVGSLSVDDAVGVRLETYESLANTLLSFSSTNFTILVSPSCHLALPVRAHA